MGCSWEHLHLPGQTAGKALRGLNEDIGNGVWTSNSLGSGTVWFHLMHPYIAD